MKIDLGLKWTSICVFRATVTPGTCATDGSKCQERIQAYGLTYYCSYYKQLCPGPCGLGCPTTIGTTTTNTGSKV